MGKNSMGYYTAYAVLVFGAMLALMFSERPLSATVVTMALFTFNLAALMFMLPAMFNFVANVKQSANAENAKILNELQRLAQRIDTLAKNNSTNSPANEASPLNRPSDTVTLEKALKMTAHTVPANANPKPITRIAAPEDAIFGARLNTPKPAVPNAPAQNNSTPATPSQPAVIITSASTKASQQQTLESLFDSAATNSEAKAQNTENQTEPANASEHHLVEPIIAMATPTEVVNPPQAVKLTAYIDIGENDVLCLRGEGGGLNWQEGIPMNEEGDSRWVWLSSASSTPITCRIYLNDEISAFGDDIVLNPGQNMEVAPSFPKVEA